MSLDVLSERYIRIALVGNPNVGKSVIFNNLTRSRQHIGNWPGKTIDKKEGTYKKGKITAYIIDLPGTYSLTAFSEEEVIARDYILHERPDVVINIVDALNLERNLYLTLQLLEMGANVIVALNKVDLLEKAGVTIDVDELQKELGVPIIPTVAPRKEGMDELVHKAVDVSQEKRASSKISYPPSVEKYIKRLEDFIDSNTDIRKTFNPRWVAIKLLEGDPDIINKIRKIGGGSEVIARSSKIRDEMRRELGDPEIVIADARYSKIKEIVEKVTKGRGRIPASDLLDKALLDKYLGIPIFLTILWALLQFAFIGSAPFCDLLGDLFVFIGSSLEGITGVPLVDYLLFGEYGIIQGLGAVLSFIPLIMALYFGLSLLEDSGYVARAAFVMDRAMRKVGLSGRAIIPMIMGIGCNVPAIYATRIIPDRSDRMVAILTNPLMTCGARLVLFSAIAGAFFGPYAGDVVLSLYLLGVILIFVVAIVLRKTLFKGTASPFIIEFPVYQRPSFKVAVVRMWDRGSLFFKKAGTIILAGLLVIGVLTVTDARTLSFTDNPENAIISTIGKALLPIFAPLGWDWRFVVAAVFGFVAKEIVLGASAMLYGVGEEEIASKMASMYSPIDMFGYMTFIQLYIPCIVAVGAIKQETGSWKWTVFAAAYGIALAYVVNFLVLIIGHALVG